jgi:hypothetical protein
MELLINHTSESNAYEVADYPYGYTARCKIRYWIETTKHKQRSCRQTTNPKTGRWNKPQKSTYSDLVVLFIEDDTGHVKRTSYNIQYGEYPTWKTFLEKYQSVLVSPYEIARIKYGNAIFRAREILYIKSLEHCASGNIYDVPQNFRGKISTEALLLAAKESGYGFKSSLMEA